jgi:hypothetical protein
MEKFEIYLYRPNWKFIFEKATIVGLVTFATVVLIEGHGKRKGLPLTPTNF